MFRGGGSGDASNEQRCCCGGCENGGFLVGSKLNREEDWDTLAIKNAKVIWILLYQYKCNGNADLLRTKIIP